MIKAKDILKKENQTNVVYKLECNDCTASYVGMSKREALDRIDEHRRPVDSIIKKKNAILNKPLPTENNHTMTTRAKGKKEKPTVIKNPQALIQDLYKTQETDPVILKHHKTTGHTFNWADFKILDRECSYQKRSMSEVIYINIQLNPINKKEDSNNLFKPYLHCFHKLKKNLN